MIFAQSIGPLDFWGRSSCGSFCRGLDRATVRDERSRALLRGSCRRRRSSERPIRSFSTSRPDEASISSAEGLGPESGPYAVVSVRKIPALARRARSSRAAVDRLAQRHGIRVAFLPLGGAGDAEVSTDVIRACASTPGAAAGVLACQRRRRSCAARASSSGCVCTRSCWRRARRSVSRDRVRSEGRALCEDLEYPLEPLWSAGAPPPPTPADRRRSSTGSSRERDELSAALAREPRRCRARGGRTQLRRARRTLKTSDDGLPRDAQPAEDRFPDEGGAAQARAGARRMVATSTGPTSAVSSATPPTGPGSCTTGRRTPTASSTWAHFLNMVLKDVFVKIALLDGKYAKFVPAGTCTAFRSSTRRSSTSASTISTRSIRSSCASAARSARSSGSTVSARRACAWETSAFGHPIARSIRRSKRRSSTRSPTLPSGSRSTRACARRSGASTTRRRSPKRRSSTSSASRRRSTCASRQTAMQREQILDAIRARRRLRAGESRFRCSSGRRRRGRCPPTLRSRCAPMRRTALYRVGDERVDRLPKALARASARRALRRGVAARPGARRAARRPRRPPSLHGSGLATSCSPITSISKPGTGAVHTAPGHGADDFETGMKYDLPILNPVDAAGRFTAEAGRYAGLQIFDANATIVDDLRAERRACGARANTSIRIRTAGAATTRSSSARPRSGSSRWIRTCCAQRAIDATDDVEYVPRWGRAAPAPDDRNASRVVHLAPAHVGHADSGAASACSATSRFSTPRVARRAAKRFGEAGASAWWSDPVEAFLPDGLRLPELRRSAFRKGEEHRRHLVRVGRNASRGARARRPAVAERHACSKAATNIAAGFAVR